MVDTAVYSRWFQYIGPVTALPAMSTAWFPQKARNPVRLTFTDKEGQEVVSDEFVFDEDCLNTKYTMALYLNQLDAGACSG